MLVQYVCGPECHVNQDYIVKVLHDKGGNNKYYIVLNDGENEPAEIDKDSYMRIVAWIEAQ